MAGNVNFVPMSSYDLEGQEIARRRKMAEMLQAQGAAPIEQQTVGGMVAPFSMTQGLAKLLQSYSGRKGQEAADEAQRALRARYQGDKSADMQLLAQALQGRPPTPAQNLQSPTEPLPGQEQMVPARPAMPAGRIDPSILGQFRTPEMSKAAMQMYVAQSNRKHDVIETVDADGRPVWKIVDLYSPPPGVLPRATKKVVLPGGQVINPFTVKEGAQFNNPSNLMGIDNNGNVVVNQPYAEASRQIAAAGASRVSTTVVNEGPKAFEREIGKADAEQLTAWRTVAQSAQSTLETVANLRGAIKDGVYSGGTANMQTIAVSIINGLTGVTPKGLVGSELFNAESSQLVLNQIKTLGTNPSDADRKFIEKTVPRLTSSPEARVQLIEYLEKKAQRTISRFEKADKYARSNRGLGGFKFDEGGSGSSGNQPIIVDF